MAIRLALLLLAACLVSCAAKAPGLPAVETPPSEPGPAAAAPSPSAEAAESLAATTWQEAVKVAVARADDGDFDYILDRMLAPELVDRLVAKHGEAEWRRLFREGELGRVTYYFGWLKGAAAETADGRTTVRGRHGCYAVFVEVEGRMLIADFGQELSTM